MKIMLNFFGRGLRIALRLIRYAVVLIVLLVIFQRSTVLTNELRGNVAFLVSEHLFDYIGWEINALAVKVDQTLWGLHPFMTEADRSQTVRDHMTQVAQAQSLEAQITAIYIDPAISNPEVASAELRIERDMLHDDLRQKQPLTEAILEGQVAAVLAEEGFAFAGQLLPPIAMHFTEVPNLLIVSPRDEIRFDISLNLYALPVNEKAAIETAIDTEHDVSSLIVPLGGIALYPAMITETASIPRSIEVFAHEWLHHYLFFYPLGLHYFTGGEGFASEARIINETTADFFGKDVARLVLARYYPDLLPPRPSASPTIITPDPGAFDFGAAMHETRVKVDELLAEGKIEEAEAYMESRRQLFVNNGYNIRKLNQAYFAFYGGYQAGGVPGVGGEDPIGPAVQSVRETSPTLHTFVERMRNITTREALLLVAGD